MQDFAMRDIDIFVCLFKTKEQFCYSVVVCLSGFQTHVWLDFVVSISSCLTNFVRPVTFVIYSVFQTFIGENLQAYIFVHFVTENIS